MRDWAGYFDAQKAGNTKEEAKGPSDKTAPKEDRRVPRATSKTVQDGPMLAVEEEKGDDHDR